MKFIAIFLLGFFTLGIADIPFEVLQRKHAKTCCGRVVCQCTHAKGAVCDFRKGIQKTQKPQESLTPHRHCHLPSATKVETHTSKNETPSVKTSNPKFSFTKAPCAGESSHKAVPGNFRDFDVILVQECFLNSRLEFLLFPRFQSPAAMTLQGIDRPPKFFISL